MLLDDRVGTGEEEVPGRMVHGTVSFSFAQFTCRLRA